MSDLRASAPTSARQPEESHPAHTAFLTYRDMGPSRTFVATARSLSKNERLIRRWATRYRWRERVWQWDQEQARQDEAQLQQHRETLLRERLADLDRIGRACLAFFRTLVRRDPETGDISFDVRFTPQVALRFLELALRAQGAFDKPAPEETPDERPTADLFGLADAELAELIDLARERADEQDQRKDNGDESDEEGTQQEQHEEQEDREEGQPERG